MKQNLKKRKPRVVAYLRISTSTQDLGVQKTEIETYAASRGLKIDKWFGVKESSKNGFKERKIDALLRELRRGDTLICSELSRLARSMRDAFIITDSLFRKKVAMHFIKQNLVLSENDMTSKVIISAFSMAAEVERDLISSRTKNGLAAAKARGKKLGNPNLRFDNAKRRRDADRFAKSLEKTIRGYQRQGMSQRAIVAELNRAGIKPRRGGDRWHLLTVQNVIRRLDRKGGGKC